MPDNADVRTFAFRLVGIDATYCRANCAVHARGRATGVSPREEDLPAIVPADGPVAVTGAAGFIGSHLVLELVRHGYTVRACVRDVANLPNTAHLRAMNAVGPGRVELFGADMKAPGAYDAAFAGCVGVFHAAAEMGNLEGSTPQKVYDGGLVATRMAMDSLKKARTVRRLIYTSSFAAVAHPADEGHTYTEDSWADMNAARRGANSTWDMETVKRNRDVAYAMTKLDSERYVYREAEANGFDAMGICPCHVIGPLLSRTHQRPWAWQTRIGDMLEGYSHRRMYWNIVDVRDVAAVQRLAMESTVNRNGERYNLVAPDARNMLPQEELQALLRRLYPGHGIGGNQQEGATFRSPVSVMQKARTQLGLEPHSLEASVRDNADSLLVWGLVTPRVGEDNWQREGRDLGIASKWNPHLYPAIDPEVRARLVAEGRV
jgi:nucleoside-diphosphate-sugar epimerase